MFKRAESPKLSRHTPIRRVGLSKIQSHHSLNASKGNEISPVKMGNVERKVEFLPSPMKDVLNLMGVAGTSKYGSKSPFKASESPSGRVIAGKKVGLKTPVKDGGNSDETVDTVKRKIELETPKKSMENETGKELNQMVSKYRSKSPFKVSPRKVKTPRKVGMFKPSRSPDPIEPVPDKTPVTKKSEAFPVEIASELEKCGDALTEITGMDSVKAALVIDEPVVDQISVKKEPEAVPKETTTNFKEIKETSPEEIIELLSDDDDVKIEKTPDDASNDTISDKKENHAVNPVKTPFSLFQPNTSSAVLTPDPSKQHKNKYNLSLTFTPDRIEEMRKRRSELLNYSTPISKRRKTQSKSLSLSETIDLTSDDTETSSPTPPMPRPVIARPSRSERITLITDLKTQLEERVKTLKTLQALHQSNMENKQLTKQWTEAGIRALEELSATRTPPMNIGSILDHLQIPHEVYGYDATMETFEPKYE